MASIQKRSNGQWRARYRDDAGKEHARHFTRKLDAQRWLDEVTASVVTGMYVDPGAGRITFGQYVDQWLPRQVWATGTAVSFDRSIQLMPFKDLPIASIRRSHVEQWVKLQATATEDRKALAPSTIKLRWTHARQVFRAAIRDKVISADPSEGVVLPRERRAEHAMIMPTPRQVRELIDASDPHFGTFLALCAFAGLRRGEAVAVKVDDVDFLERRLNVVRQRQRDQVQPPKFGSERVVSLPDDLVTMLSVHVGDFPHADGWLFVGERGPAGDHWANYQMVKARKATGHAEVTVHSLRHFYASGLISAGCDVVTVQRSLGHASATTTLQTYSHLWPKAEDRTRSASAAIMGQVFAAPADSLRTGEGETGPD